LYFLLLSLSPEFKMIVVQELVHKEKRKKKGKGSNSRHEERRGM
jgi:stalled ribosome alternative rescue factor ArfA